MPPSDDQDDEGTSPRQRRPAPKRQSSISSYVSQSPADASRATHHKPARHVVHGHGHGRMGRNQSFHRTLSKIKITPAQADDNHVDQSTTPKARPQRQDRALSTGSVGADSPRPAMKRNSTSVVLPRNTSNTALKKNNSSGQLSRVGSSKHVAHVAHAKHSTHLRPAAQRSATQQSTRKQSKSSPPPQPKHSVHFDVGGDDDEDDGEEMEGVDDVWTEESASASPTNTRDNTRNNTRQNSVVLDPEQNPYAAQNLESKPPDDDDEEEENEGDEDDEEEDEEEEEENDITPQTEQPRKRSSVEEEQIRRRDFAATAAQDAAKQESHAHTEEPQHSQREHHHNPNHQHHALDTDAIAKRLLERTHAHNVAPPRVSSISAMANASPGDKSLISHVDFAVPTATTTGASNTPVVSRFLASEETDSKTSTPAEQSGFLRGHTRQGSHSQPRSKEPSDLIRNKSAPNFAQPKSPASSGPGSGAVTPDPMNHSRTQQKLWLQRGLSNIEASSQPHLPGLLPTGRAQAMRTPHTGKPHEFVDKEYAVVRRFVDPLHDALIRIKKANGGVLPGKPKKGTQTPNPAAKRLTAPPVSTSASSKKGASSKPKEPPQRQKVKFHTGSPEDDHTAAHDDGDEDADREESVADIARRLWEQPVTIAAEA